MQIVEPIRDLNDIKLLKQLFSKDKIRNLVLFVLGINCGLRISDLLRLKVSDVKKKKYIEILESKTGKIKRIPITKVIKSILADYIYKKSPEENLFKSQKGNKAISRIQAYRILKEAAKKANLLHIGTHSLRKTFGYHFYKKTKDIALLQNIFNHSSPKVTLRYIGINQDIIDSSLMKFAL